MRYFSILLLSLFCLLPNFLHSQEESLSALHSIEQLTDSVEKLMKKAKIPGILLSIVTKDSVYYIDGLGMSNIAEDRPVDAYQLFRMGSISKSFASLCIMKLIEEGKLSLNDNLKDIAPEIPFTNKWEDSHPVKIINLLQHTAGFDDMHFAAMYNRGTEEPDMLDMINIHKNSLYTRWPPNTRMSYSNPCFVILGYLIEKFSKMSYHDYVKQTVFDPLGMDHSNFLSFKDDESKYAMGYERKDGEVSPIPFRPINAAIAGTLNSCGHDMAKLLQFFINNGQVDSLQVFSSEQIDLMEKPSTTLATQKGITYGYGLANYYSHNDKKVVFNGHNGGIDGFSSTYAYNRELGIGFSISNNINGNHAKIEKLIIEFLTKDYEPSEVGSQPISEEEIKPYLGFYLNSSPRNQLFSEMNRPFNGLKIEFNNDTVYTKSFLGNPVPLIHMGDLKFRRKNHREATHVFAMVDGKPVYSRGGDYNEKYSFAFTMFKIGLMILSMIVTMSFALVGFIFIILGLKKEFSKEVMEITVPEFIAGLSFILTFVTLTTAVSSLWDLGKVNMSSLFFFIFPILGAFSAFVGLGMAIKNYSKIKSSALAIYLMIVAISGAYFSYYLWVNDIIGIRFWAY